MEKIEMTFKNLCIIHDPCTPQSLPDTTFRPNLFGATVPFSKQKNVAPATFRRERGKRLNAQ
jgi:hypothetical protein